MQFATIKGLRIEKYTLQSQNWRESAKTNKTLRLITARRNSRGSVPHSHPCWPPLVITSIETFVLVVFTFTFLLGGLFGLFAGVSFLSLIEVLFWCLDVTTTVGLKRVKLVKHG
jgi:hypothetical protein